MKHFKFSKIVSAIALGAALSGPAFAADEVKNDGRKTGKPGAPSAQSQGMVEIRATHLIDKEVTNQQGEELGEIEELIIDMNNARVHYAVLSYGGVAGIGDKLFAYPVSAFKFGPNEKLILNVAKAQLKKNPGFKSNSWPNWDDANTRAQIDRDSAMPAKETVKLKQPENQRLVRATQLLDKDVNNAQGQEIGELEDLVVNLKNGRIHYAVMEFDNSWNLGDNKLFAIPVTAFKPTQGGEELVLNLDKSQIDAKRGFDEKQWPNINDQAYIVDIDRYLVTILPAGRGPAEVPEKAEKPAR
ncbi:MAG: PRC-barrel domain-containing protein [Burkholderiales bacterium]|nr:PRC-barrel domain-containing protein [Burkholderiales bacterium]